MTINQRRLHGIGLLVMVAAALSRRFLPDGAVTGFACGWMAFGLTLLLSYEKKAPSDEPNPR